MISKEKVKFYAALQQKKFREQHRLFLAEGSKVVHELLQSAYQPESILVSNSFAETDSFRHLMQSHKNFRPEIVSEKDLARMSTHENPEGILAVVHIPAPSLTMHGKAVLYLDEINDPGNLGTLLRSALWFGFTTVITSPGCADIFNPKTVRSSMGSLFRLNCINRVPDHLIKGLLKPEYTLFVADMNGSDYTSVSYPEKICIAVGNEHHGARELVRSLADTIVTIPGSGAMESLNAAIAGSVLMAHISRAFTK